MLKPFEWRGWEVTLVKHKTNVICPIKTKQMAQEANQNAQKTKPGKTRVMQVTVGFVFAAD